MEIFKPTIEGLATITGSLVVTGSTSVTGDLTVEGTLNTTFDSSTSTAISGAFTSDSSSLAQRISDQEDFSSSLDATFATDADLNLVSSSVDSLNAATSSYALEANISGSFTSVSQSLAGRITSNEGSVSALNSASSSYLLNTTDTLTGDLTVTGTITAQEFHTEFVSASILYDSGSTKFGNSADDTHEFTGSIASTGNLTIGDNHFIGNQTTFDNLLLQSSTAENIVLSSANDIYISTQGTSPSSVGNTRLFISSSGNIGIGTITPTSKLHVVGTSLLNGATTVSGGALTTTSTISAGGSITAAATGFIELKADQTDSAAIRLGVSSASTEAFVIADNSGTGHITGDTSFKVMGYASSTLTEYARFTSTSTQIKQGNLIVDGSAGIGTTSPASKIHIHTTDAAARPLRLGSSGNSYVALDMYTDTIAQQNLYLIAYGSANAQDGSFAIKNNASHTTTNGTAGDIWFATGASSTERMRIVGSTGNVGIGTTSPGVKLHIHGTDGQGLNITGGTNNRNMLYTNANIDFRSTTTSGWAFGLRSYTNDGSTLMSYVGGAYGVGPLSSDFRYNYYGGTGYNDAAMYIPASKNVGIGTTSPTSPLHVVGGSSTINITGNNPTGYTNILFVGTGRTWATGVGNASATSLGLNDKYYIYDGSGGGTRFVIDTSGNVGIGTTTPRYQLDLAKPQDAEQVDYIGLGVNNGPSGGGGTALGSGIIWKANYSGYTKRSAGIVQIAESNYFQSGLAFYTNGTANSTTDWVEAMRISKDQKVGIGTTSPAGKLEVRYDTTANNENYIYSTSKTGANSSYNGTGLHINAIPKNNTGDTGISYLSLESRYKYLNGNHGTSAYITNTPGTGTAYGDGQIDFFIRDNTAPYTFKNDPNTSNTYWMDPVMTVRSDGAVLKPNLPGFSVYLGNSTTSNSNLVFTGVYYNTGNHYSTSTGTFTAPVAGTYFFYWGSILRTTSGTYRLKLHRNGSAYGWNNTNGNVELRGQVAASTSYETNASRVFTHYLSQYDYVQVALTTSPSSVGVYGDEWTYFGGYLLS